jgi:hypothetical protein
MKKFIVWTIALLFCLSTSLVFAAEEKKDPSKEGSGIPGGVPAPQKDRQEVKKERAAKKKKQVKKPTEEKVAPVTDKTREGVGAPAGVAAPQKAVEKK